MNAKPNWLQGVISRAAVTQPYKFEDGPATEKVITDLEVLASYCEQAAADLEVQRAVLIDAENHVVECQAEVLKSETFLERRQAAYIQAAKSRAGVPV